MPVELTGNVGWSCCQGCPLTLSFGLSGQYDKWPRHCESNIDVLTAGEGAPVVFGTIRDSSSFTHSRPLSI